MRFVIVATSLIVTAFCGWSDSYGQTPVILNPVNCVDPNAEPGTVTCDDLNAEPFGVSCPAACNVAMTGAFCDSAQEVSVTVMSSGTSTTVTDFTQIQQHQTGVALVADDVHSCYRTKECRCEVMNGVATCKEQSDYLLYLLYDYSISQPEEECGFAGGGGGE